MVITEDFILISDGDLDMGIRFIRTAATFGVSTVGFIRAIGKAGIITMDAEVLPEVFVAADMEAELLMEIMRE
jgi:hypothetical protein